MSFPAAPWIAREGRPSILFVHDSYPGQFGGFARWLARNGWEVWTAGRQREGARDQDTLEGVRHLTYLPHRPPSPATHPYAQPFDRAALIGQACARSCLAARAAGLNPELVVSHTGPGPGLFLQDVFPDAVQLAYCEWWYDSPGPDTAFLAGLCGGRPDSSPEAAILEHRRNLPIASELLAAGRGICPTRFQQSRFPDPLRALLTVQHDGVDCAIFQPGPAGSARHPGLAGIAPDTPVVSYATRGMEPHRGFPQVMEAFAALQARNPHVVAVVAGENAVHYGGDSVRRIDWKAEALERYALDPIRTLFTGTLAAHDYLWLLRRSDAHVYATVPFVLSWSMLEAMASGTPLILSDTAPVREFADDRSALLFDLAQPDRMTEAIEDALTDRVGARRRATAARAIIRDRYDTLQVYPDKADWLLSLLPAGRCMPPRPQMPDLSLGQSKPCEPHLRKAL